MPTAPQRVSGSTVPSEQVFGGTNRYHRSNLHEAARNGPSSCVSGLIECKADLESKDDYGRTSLHYAALEGKEVATLQILIKARANINVQDSIGCTPLLYATERPQTWAVEELLWAKADISIKDASGMTALELAQLQNRPESVKLISQPSLVKPTTGASSQSIPGVFQGLLGPQDKHDESHTHRYHQQNAASSFSPQQNHCFEYCFSLC